MHPASSGAPALVSGSGATADQLKDAMASHARAVMAGSLDAAVIYNKLHNQLQAIERAQGRAGGGSPGYGLPASLQTPSWDDIQAYIDGLKPGVASGDLQSAQAYNRARSAQRSIQRAQNDANGPSFRGVLSQALLRSRFGLGNSPALQPLGVDILKVGRAAGLATAGLAALGVIATGVYVQFKALQNAMERGERLRVDKARFGGSAEQIGAGRSLAGGMNLDYDSAVQAIASSAEGGGYGAAAAQQAGIKTFAPPGGRNMAEDFLKAADYIRKSSDFGEAQRRASSLGVADMADIYNLSDKQYQNLRDDSKKRDDNSGAMRNLNVETQRLQSAWGKFSDAISGPTIEAFTQLLEKVNDFIDILDPTKLGKMFRPTGTGVPALVRDFIELYKGGGQKSAAESAAQSPQVPGRSLAEDQLGATKELTREMRNVRETFAGFSDRAKASSPTRNVAGGMDLGLGLGLL